MTTQAPTKVKQGDSQVVREISNPFGWLMARNNRMARHLQQTPELARIIMKVCRAYDLFCRQRGVHTPEQMARVSHSAIFNEGTSNLVITIHLEDA